MGKEPSFLTIPLSKVVGCYLERLLDAFADCDAGHHYDELRPAISLVHLKDRFDIAIGLTRSCLHLDIRLKSHFALVIRLSDIGRF